MNSYLSKIKEIKKDILGFENWQIKQEEKGDVDYSSTIWTNFAIGVSNARIKLQTAVEFLQMTKEVKLNDVEYMRAYFSMATNEEAWNIYQSQIDVELENINSALKEAGDKT